MRNLPLDTVQKICRGSLFESAVTELQMSMDQEFISAEAEDPVRLLLRSKAKSAATRLGEEMDNFDMDTGGSASTRIKAADTILNLSGYGKQEVTNNLAVIMLSPDKLKAVHSADARILENVPDMVDGFS